MEIPALAVALLGLGATLKYSYQVLVEKKIKNIGALVSMLYLTVVYIFIAFPSIQEGPYHAASWVRIGVFLIFCDKVLVFGYELLGRYSLIKCKKRN